MYNIKLSKDVEKFLMFHPDIATRFFVKADIMLENPLDPSLDIKKLQWENDKYRLRIGKYRFLYEIQDNIVLVYFYKADSRGDIYK